MPSLLGIGLTCVFSLGSLDHIAEYIDSFLKEQKLTDTEDLLHLGYTFSFPVLQSEVSLLRQGTI